MDKIELLNEDFTIIRYNCTIVHVSEISTSEVYLSGGNVRVKPDTFSNKYYADVEPVKLFTESKRTQEIHFITPDGSQGCFTLTNLNIPLRSGLNIELLGIENRDLADYYFIKILNYNRKFRIKKNYTEISRTLYRKKYSKIYSISYFVFFGVLNYKNILEGSFLIILLTILALTVFFRILIFFHKIVILKKIQGKMDSLLKTF